MVQGKPGDNVRYVFTKIDKTPHFLIMSKCNFCPFVINDFNGGCARCSKFSGKGLNGDKSSNYIDKVYGYMQKGYGTMEMEMLTEVGIPSWCNLPNHLTKISPNDAITTVVDGQLYIESGQNYSNTVQIISDKEVMFDKSDFETLILKPKDNKRFHYNNGKRTTPSKPIKVTKMCSSCGEDKEDVDREKRDGMCGECWEKYKRNKKKRYDSKINNFRLKRDKSWKNKEYKQIKV